LFFLPRQIAQTGKYPEYFNAAKSLGKQSEGKLVYFMSIENARFRKPVVPGDQLIINVEKTRERGNVFKFDGKVYVQEIVVAEARFSAMIVDK